MVWSTVAAAGAAQCSAQRRKSSAKAASRSAAPPRRMATFPATYRKGPRTRGPPQSPQRDRHAVRTAPRRRFLSQHTCLRLPLKTSGIFWATRDAAAASVRTAVASVTAAVRAPCAGWRPAGARPCWWRFFSRCPSRRGRSTHHERPPPAGRPPPAHASTRGTAGAAGQLPPPSAEKRSRSRLATAPPAAPSGTMRSIRHATSRPLASLAGASQNGATLMLPTARGRAW